MMDRLMAAASLLLLAMAAWLVVLARWWLLFDGNPPVVFDPVEVPVERAVYRTGDDVYVTSNFCLRVDVNSSVSRIMVEQSSGGHSYILRLNAPGVGLAKGCYSRRFVIASISPDMVPGIYHIVHTAVYQVNPLAERQASFRTTVFRVER